MQTTWWVERNIERYEGKSVITYNSIKYEVEKKICLIYIQDALHIDTKIWQIQIVIYSDII